MRYPVPEKNQYEEFFKFVIPYHLSVRCDFYKYSPNTATSAIKIHIYLLQPRMDNSWNYSTQY